jgi:7-carboxy-7-deazaguanine synthase
LTLIKIAEIYESIQGEGLYTGTPSVFVRVSGCNLRCHFCDSPFTSWNPEGTAMGLEEILRTSLAYPSSHIVVTGGEPMLFPEIADLSHRLSSAGRLVTMETAGTVWQRVSCELMSISPKLRNSTPSVADHPAWHVRHEQTREQPEVLQKLVKTYRYQVKFVIADPSDVSEVEAYLSRYPEIDRDSVYLMPEGTSSQRLAAVTAWLEPHCVQHQFHFCPRKHIEWFGHTRGT